MEKDEAYAARERGDFMKKLFCVFLCVLTAVLMCSCKKEEEPENQPALKQQAEVWVEKKEEEIKPEPPAEPEKPKEPEKEEKPEKPKKLCFCYDFAMLLLCFCCAFALSRISTGGNLVTGSALVFLSLVPFLSDYS